MLKVVQEGSEANATSGSLLDEIVRDGARQMLAAALQAEVAAYIDSCRDQLDADGRRLVVRNGSHVARGGDHGGRGGAGQGSAGERQTHR